jgi:hypothetical protein
MANRNDPDYTPADRRNSVDEERVRSGVEDPTDLADDTGDEFEDEDNEDLDEETGEGEDTF